MRGGRMIGLGADIVAQPIARQAQPVDGADHRIGVEPGVRIGRVGVVDREAQTFGRASGEVGFPPIGEEQIAAAFILMCVVLHDEPSGAPHHVEPHQVAPIVGVVAFFERGQRPHRALVPADEFRLPAQRRQQPFRADAEIRIFA